MINWKDLLWGNAPNGGSRRQRQRLGNGQFGCEKHTKNVASDFCSIQIKCSCVIDTFVREIFGVFELIHRQVSKRSLNPISCHFAPTNTMLDGNTPVCPSCQTTYTYCTNLACFSWTLFPPVSWKAMTVGRERAAFKGQGAVSSHTNGCKIRTPALCPWGRLHPIALPVWFSGGGETQILPFLLSGPSPAPHPRQRELC